MSWFSGLFNRRTAQWDPRRDSLGSFAMAFVPPSLRLTEEEMISTSVVWACIRAIVDPIATSEFKVFTRDANGGRKRLMDDDVAWMFNVRPNPDMPAQAFKEILLTQTLVHGDGYAEIVRNRAGKVQELVALDSERMTLQRNGDDLVYVYRQVDGEPVVLFADEVLHVRGPSIRGLTGDSLVYRASKAVALHVAQERFATAYFENGAVLGGFVKLPGGLGEEARKRLRADILQRFGGHKKAHGIMFGEAGMEYQELGGNPAETQLVPSRSFSVEDISRYFQVPLVRLAVQAAAQGYGTNVSQLNLQFSRETLEPWKNRITEEAQYKLYPQRTPWREIEIETTWLTQGDDVQRAQAREIDIRCGVLTVNEGREQEGKNSIGPAGDLHLVQNNLVVLDEENLTKPEPLPAPERTMRREMDDEDEMPDMRALVSAVERYTRQIRARRADLEKAGKTPDEIAENIAQTLRGKAFSSIAAAIDGLPLDPVS